MQPATRKVVQRSPSHTVRLIPLPHLQADPVEADSSVERDFVHRAARFPDLHSIRHQPFTLKFKDSSYTPDFLLTFKDQSKLVVEVKPTEKVDGYKGVFDLACKKLGAVGMLFMVAEDTIIRANGKAEIARRIRRYAKASCRWDERVRISDICEASAGGISIANLERIHSVRTTELFHLIAIRVLATLPPMSLDSSTLVHIPKQNPQGESHAVQFASWFDTEIWHANA